MNAQEIAELARATLGEKTLEEENAEKAAKEAEQIQAQAATVYTDADGITYEWDATQQGWFPQLNEEFYAQYQNSYGGTPSIPTANSKTEENKTITPESNKEILEKKPEKRQKRSSEWVELEDIKNPNIYVTGLPKKITAEKFIEFFKKGGILKLDDSGNPKIKLYRDASGEVKGDGLVTYLKIESVALAMDFLNGTEIMPGFPVELQQAKFEQKGDYVSKRKKKKGKNNNQQKQLSWEEKKETKLKSSKVQSVVILKHLFNPKEFEDDPSGIQEISEDVREESERCGTVNKVIVYDRHKDGIVSVRFKEPEGAQKCIRLMNGRWFGGAQVVAENWDGKTDYKIEETDHEREERLEKWNNYLAAGHDKNDV